MIATRLSPVWHVAGVALAALGCYLVSQWVASERAALAKVDRQIVAEQDRIAKLSTEITARSRLTQIENWNRQLALQAPRPGQYVDSGFQLASLFAHDARPQLPLDPAAVPAAASPIQHAALQAAPPAASPHPLPAIAPAPALPVQRPAIVQAALHAAPVPAAVRPAVQQVALRAPAAAANRAKAKAAPVSLLDDTLFRSAAYVRPAANPLDAGSPAEVAYRPSAPTSLLSADIAGLARAERSRSARKRPE